ncbi:MAG: hypothetical protein NTY48_00775 [Candidatus Diapherotrites archaeon]|nr:hypothetical protein [Candidatus Diapherotrites archaeon]
MIIVFLVVLIMALIIANVLVSAAKPKKTGEKGFANPYYESAEIPEVIDQIDSIHENTALIKGALAATNQKIELINSRVTTLEKVVMTITQQKILEHNKNSSTEED